MDKSKWHGWCWRFGVAERGFKVGQFDYYSFRTPCLMPQDKPSAKGKWVRVKFVEVKPAAKGVKRGKK